MKKIGVIFEVGLVKAPVYFDFWPLRQSNFVVKRVHVWYSDSINVSLAHILVACFVGHDVCEGKGLRVLSNF